MVWQHARRVHGLQRTILGITYSQDLVRLLLIELHRHWCSVSRGRSCCSRDVEGEDRKNPSAAQDARCPMQGARNIWSISGSTTIIWSTTVPQYLSINWGQASFHCLSQSNPPCLNSGVQGGWRVWLPRKVRYLGQGSMIDVRLQPATLDEQKHRILSYQIEYQLGHYWYCVFTSIIQKTYNYVIVCRYLLNSVNNG